MKITQEQLDKDAQASLAMVSNLPWIRVADDTKQYHCDYVLGILAAHFGEPIEVEEPEPEIDDADDFFALVAQERQHQIEKGYDATHDDHYTPREFGLFIADYAMKPQPDFVKVAALAQAAHEASERLAERIVANDTVLIIPEAVLQKVTQETRHFYGGSLDLETARIILLAAYKAGWGGMRK